MHVCGMLVKKPAREQKKNKEKRTTAHLSYTNLIKGGEGRGGGYHLRTVFLMKCKKHKKEERKKRGKGKNASVLQGARGLVGSPEAAKIVLGVLLGSLAVLPASEQEEPDGESGDANTHEGDDGNLAVGEPAAGTIAARVKVGVVPTGCFEETSDIRARNPQARVNPL